MAKSDVDCQRIVKDIRKEYDDIIWVSASIRGTKLYIRVKENEDSPSVTAKENAKQSGEQGENVSQPVDIVADKSCIIESAIVRNGLIQTEIGAKVKKGDVLVSGQIPVNNDAGEIIGYQYHVSDADIIGKTALKYEDSCPNTYIEKEDSDIRKQEYYFKVGNIRFTLGGIRNDYENFTMSGQQWQLKIFDNFFFPVYWGKRWAIPYKPHEKQRRKEEIQKILTERFVRYCEDLEKKGVEIIENDVKIYTGSAKAEAKGTLTVITDIGTERPTSIVEDVSDGDD